MQGQRTARLGLDMGNTMGGGEHPGWGNQGPTAEVALAGIGLAPHHQRRHPGPVPARGRGTANDAGLADRRGGRGRESGVDGRAGPVGGMQEQDNQPNQPKQSGAADCHGFLLYAVVLQPGSTTRM